MGKENNEDTKPFYGEIQLPDGILAKFGECQHPEFKNNGWFFVSFTEGKRSCLYLVERFFANERRIKDNGYNIEYWQRNSIKAIPTVDRA